MKHHINSVISTTIKEFNKYTGAEIQAKLISSDKNTFTIRFYGSFCYTCGLIDYFEDFKLLLQEKTGLKFKIQDYKETDQDTYLVKYSLL
ncbi:MAG: hypothetical protein QW327_03615 [Candidatus Odinarchaeota archaeon]